MHKKRERRRRSKSGSNLNSHSTIGGEGGKLGKGFLTEDTIKPKIREPPGNL
jgi:hypothetical protein